MTFGFFSIGSSEIAIIMVVALVIFGAEKLPEIGRQIGMAYKELNRLRGDVHKALDIDQYTRDLPDYSSPSESTYSYNGNNTLNPYTPPGLDEPEEDLSEGARQELAVWRQEQGLDAPTANETNKNDVRTDSYSIDSTDSIETDRSETAYAINESKSEGTAIAGERPSEVGGNPATTPAVTIASTQPAPHHG